MSMATNRGRLYPLAVRIARAWDRFWFTPQPPHAISLFRILFGGLVLAEVLYKLPYRHELYADDAFNYSSISKYAVSGGWTDRLYAILVVSLVAFTIGAFTRVANLAAFAIFLYFYPDPTVVRDGMKSAEVAIWKRVAQIAQTRAQGVD